MKPSSKKKYFILPRPLSRVETHGYHVKTGKWGRGWLIQHKTMYGDIWFETPKPDPDKVHSGNVDNEDLKVDKQNQ